MYLVRMSGPEQSIMSLVRLVSLEYYSKKESPAEPGVSLVLGSFRSFVDLADRLRCVLNHIF